MILIFDSRFGEYGSPHIDLIVERLKERKLSYHIVSPHNLENGEISVVQKDEEVFVEIAGDAYKPSLVYLSSLWRTDCIIELPQDEMYPGAFRARIQQFLQDIRFVLEDSIWCPGSILSIERAESKPVLLAKAALAGIKVPSFTVDAFSGSSSVPRNCELYKKQLGSPFIISMQSEKGVEVGVTTTNTLVDPKTIVSDHQPWQWQKPVPSIAQVRCCVVKDKVWSVIWKRTSDLKLADFRELNEFGERELLWEEHVLPSDLKNRLLRLCESLGLYSCCPEFLITEDGQYVLIDFNPCGDWYGFFSDRVRNKITEAFVNLFSKLVA